MRIHITGGSGSGTTTLGRELAAHLGFAHFDGDDYYWLPTSPPFQKKRDAAARLAAVLADLQAVPNAVFSGSIVGWGPELEDGFDLIVFLYLPAQTRVERLRKREVERFGAADPDFLQWAAQYDEGPSEGRSLAKHNSWLAARRCPCLRLESDISVADRIRLVVQALSNLSVNADAHGRPAAGASSLGGRRLLQR
ncbi:MAG: AAA family ATPase [Burkholderiales bacterium]|nr:AAA family ATPase [Burkholderiales bacterium]